MATKKKIAPITEVTPVVEQPVVVAPAVAEPVARVVFIDGTGSFDVGVNGRFQRIPRGQRIEVSEGVYHVLLNAGLLLE